MSCLECENEGKPKKKKKEKRNGMTAETDIERETQVDRYDGI